MTTTAIKTTAVNTADAENLAQFFSSGKLLRQACLETGISYNATRRNLNGPAQNVRLLYVVRLTEWVLMWKKQKSEREALGDG